MQTIEGRTIYAATDLNNDLACLHLSALERSVARGEALRPPAEGQLKLIAEKGDLHERAYLATMRAQYGAALIEFPARIGNSLAEMYAAEAATLAAMASGAPLIYQATFFDGRFLGRTDFLRRVDEPSGRWGWSYEVIDTKLALSAKPTYVIQLCNYSEHVERLQGSAPAFAAVVLGSLRERRFRLADFSAYYRYQKAAFLERMATPPPSYPAETAHCSICRWFDVCEAQRERDDYLGLVAWMRADQIERLQAGGITKLPELAAARDEQRPQGMRPETFATLRAQAALQQRQRVAIATGQAERHFYEFCDHVEGTGFAQLPPPAPGDVFFDMEGDPLYAPERGLEYLFGVYLPDERVYRSWWGKTPADERLAFEGFVDFVSERLATYPDLHVYHYAPYEPTALKRLMGTFGSREVEIDGLLQREIFVDLYAVVRQSVRISQPKYSIKKLEAFYGMQRHTDVKRGDDSIVNFEIWLATGDQAILDDIERYNEDDCVSTHLLREWLLARRTEFEKLRGTPLPWRVPHEPAEEKPVDPLAAVLLAGIEPPETPAGLRSAPERVRAAWLLGNLLEYHRRDAKPAWWKLFERGENLDLLVEFDSEALGGLRYLAEIPPFKLGPRDRNLVYTFSFPDQPYNLGKAPCCPIERVAVEVVDLDEDRHRVQIKLGGGLEPTRLRALVPGKPLQTTAQREALHRVAERLAAGTLEADQPAIYDLLTARPPRLRGVPRGSRLQPAAVSAAAVAAVVGALDASYLFIQGPPGSGKSTLGGTVIAGLVAAGSRVGVVSRSHKAIHHLLSKVECELAARGERPTGLYGSNDDENAYVSALDAPLIVNAKTNAFAQTPHRLAGGTAWLFAREDLIGAYDYLFVDEAGQMALADVVACAPAARNVVLLGDPLQLAQVSQGTHPLGSGASILEHLLGAAPTVPPERGIFLDVSYRMQPEICAFISEHVYAGRLRNAEETATHRITAPGLSGGGLSFVPVEHHGNSRSSAEEAAAIVAHVGALVRGSVCVRGKPERPLGLGDILIVTPYNAQRRLLERALGAAGLPGIGVGTVDKFQGQEAPVVFYSMATSSGDDLPRDMRFLFERNRFNVAVSRAQCLSVLVCSPRLLGIECATPEQMELANMLCAFVEAAQHAPPAAVP